MERLTKTGLVVPDRVPWGTHLCQFFETKDDLLEVLVPYFKEGLAANESCMWITSAPISVEEAKSALLAAVPDLDDCLATGQMEILPHDRWYLIGGCFNIDALVDAWGGKLAIALGHGYCGLRISGDVSCMQDDRWPKLVDYEEKIHASIHAKHIVGLCSYAQSQCAVAQFLQVVNAHDFAIVKRAGGWECVESKGTRRLMDRVFAQNYALASSISPMAITDLAGRLTYANPAAVSVWGYDNEAEVLGRLSADFWKDGEMAAAYLEKVRRDGACVREGIGKRKDGSTFPVEVLGSLIRDGQGKPTGMVASFLDVTARKEAEAARRESEEHYRNLVENIDLGIALVNGDHRVEAVNAANARMIGKTLDDCIGRECFRVFEKREHVCAHCPGVQAMRTGLPAEAETLGVRDDGSTYHARLQAFPVFDAQGKPTKFIEVIEDITQQKQEQDALRRANFCLEQASDCIFWITPDARIAYVNRKACETLEFTAEELQSMSVLDVDPTMTPAKWESHWREIQRRKAFVMEAVLQTKSGRVIPVEIGVNHMTFDGREYDCAFVRDISERKEAERHLAHFSAIVNSSQNSIIGARLDGIVTSCNPGAERLYGYTAAEMIGQSIVMFMPPDRPMEVLSHMATLEAGGQPKHYDTVRRRKDGTLVDVSVTLSPIKNSDGKVIGASAITSDITDRKRAEAALRQKHDELQAIYAGIIEGLLITDIETKRVQRVNRSFCQMLGYAEQELLSMSISDLHPADSVSEDLLRFQAAVDGHTSLNQDRPVLRKDGSIFYADITGHTIVYNNRPCLLALFRDITERKQAEERYRSLIDNIRLGIALVDAEYRIVMANEAVARLVGRSSASCAGEHCFRVFRNRESVCDDCPGVQAMITGRPAEIEDLHLFRDGKPLVLRVRAFPVLDANGSPSGFIEVVEDATERKQAEQDLARAKVAAEAASRAKSEFLANMSHEIRTPMTAILGFADILMEEEQSGNAPPDRLDAIRTIQRNGEHLLDLINGILDLSRIEAGQQILDLRACSPRELVEEVIATMKIRADAKGLPLSVEYRGDIPEKIQTDSLRLRQILVNLVGNAIKFTDTGDVRVVVQQDAIAAGRLQFAIIDTGIGIAGEHLAMLFQPFSQVDASARRRFGGTGLGLAISRRLAIALGGDITVSSAAGKGSTFTASIAMERPAAPYYPAGSATTERIATAGSGAPRLDCRILLAEDGPDNQRLISYLLRKEGAEVTVVEDGRKALEQVVVEGRAGTSPDVILMDMQMPVLDGYEATRKLRDMGYKGRVIALTAHAMKQDRQKCLDAGCDDYLTKPVDRKTLLQVVARYGRELRAEQAAGSDGPGSEYSA